MYIQLMKSPRPVISSNIYSPGLISIIGLPVVCIAYLYFYQTKYAMPVWWFDNKGIERLNTHFSQKVDFENFRTYTNLYLTGDQRHNMAELEKLKRLADDVVSKSDFKSGIRIVLTNDSQYQDLVTLLDICMNYRTIGVVPYNNHVLVFKWSNDKSLSPAKPIDDSALLPPDANQRWFLLDSNELPDYEYVAMDWLKPFWPSLIPFGGMIFFWRKRNSWNVGAH